MIILYCFLAAAPDGSWGHLLADGDMRHERALEHDIFMAVLRSKHAQHEASARIAPPLTACGGGKSPNGALARATCVRDPLHIPPTDANPPNPSGF